LLPTLYNKQMKKHVDLIINSRWILPVVPNHSLLHNYTVVVQDGKVIDICALSIANAHYQASEYIDLDDHVLIPGFINLHTHAAMNLLRGLADDVPLMPWLQEHIWPAETKLISPAFVYDGTLLACAEMLSGGITCFNDMYFYPESAAAASIKAGLRVNLGLVVLEFPTQYAHDADSYIQQGLNVRDHLREEPLIQFSLAPHAPYTVSDTTFNRIVMLAEQVNIGVHTHMHETQEEIAQSEQIHGLRPLKRLANLGLLGPNLTLAHCVYLDEAEIKLLAENGCNIAHCPSSNLKLASGIAPINAYLKQGVNIGLGTDGAASNNRLDMFTEMRLAALLAKGQSGDATAVSAHQALEMATINGAKAMNLQDKIGSIEIGKQADFSAVRMSEFEMHPCFDVVSHLVYVAGREQVSHVWVEGDLKYHKPENSRGIFSNIEPQELTDIISKWQPKVSEFR
jgi:5-methylthioadenosine/S-adenosylhomocysteine deaminase